jgi:hypothetical protein
MAEMLDSGRHSLVKRWNIPLPKFMVIKAFNKLMYELAEVMNKTAIKQELETGVMRVKLYNKAFTLYPALIDLVTLKWDEETLRRVEDLTGYKLNNLDDLKVLVNETKRLQDKYKEYSVEAKKEGEMSFVQVIISVEIVLERTISRDTKLYEFEHYLKAANEKIKQLTPKE